MCPVTSATPALRKGKETSSEGPSSAAETAPAGPSKQIHLTKSVERPKGSGKPRLANVASGLLQ